MKYKGKLPTVASHLTAQQHQCALPRETHEAASQSSCLLLSCKNLQGQHYFRNNTEFKKRKKIKLANSFVKKKNKNVCKLNLAEDLF